MKKNIYLIFDDIDNKVLSYFDAPTFGHVIRNNWRFFQKMNSFFDEDWLVFEVGTISDSGMPVFYDDFKPVSWSDYLTPEIQADRLSLKEQSQLRSQPSGVTGNPPPEVR